MACLLFSLHQFLLDLCKVATSIHNPLYLLLDDIALIGVCKKFTQISKVSLFHFPLAMPSTSIPWISSPNIHWQPSSLDFWPFIVQLTQGWGILKNSSTPIESQQDPGSHIPSSNLLETPSQPPLHLQHAVPAPAWESITRETRGNVFLKNKLQITDQQRYLKTESVLNESEGHGCMRGEREAGQRGRHLLLRSSLLPQWSCLGRRWHFRQALALHGSWSGAGNATEGAGWASTACWAHVRLVGLNRCRHFLTDEQTPSILTNRINQTLTRKLAAMISKHLGASHALQVLSPLLQFVFPTTKRQLSSAGETGAA